MVELNELKQSQTLFYYEPYHNMILKVRVRGVSEDSGLVHIDGRGAIPKELLFKSRKELIRIWLLRLYFDEDKYEKKLKLTKKILDNMKRLAEIEELRPETICETCVRSCKDIDVAECEGYKRKEETE